MSSRLFLSVFLLAAVCPLATAKAATRPARCPEEPHVVGTYYNDGKKCVRDSKTLDRSVVDAVCPDGYTFKTGLCRKEGWPAKEQECPSGWARYLRQCYAPCPDGYKAYKKNGKGTCVLPRDKLNSDYMTCDDPSEQKLGAKCTKMVKCDIPTVPGNFHYWTGMHTCVRQKHIIPMRKVPASSQNECPGSMVLVPKSKTCQEPCPEGYITRIGSCKLPRCKLPTDLIGSSSSSAIICPEGSYQMPWTIM